jgi:phage protein D
MSSAILAARRALPSLVIGGVDVLLGLDSDKILSFTYTDNTSDEADSISVTLSDPKLTWLKKYFPDDKKKGVECEAGIRITNWLAPLDNRDLPCGTFYIDKVSHNGPVPSIVSVSASSIPRDGIKGTKKYKSWDNSYLQDIAAEIANAHNLTPVYDTQNNPQMKRIEQTETSDLEFLRSLCKDNSLDLKIHRKQLVIYSQEEYDQKPPAFTVTRGASNILLYSFDSKGDETFEEAEESYLNPETGKITTEVFSPSRKPYGTKARLMENEGIPYEKDDASMAGSASALIIVPRFTAADDFNDDPAANKGKGKGGKKKAKEKAKAKLRDKNKEEYQASMTLHGNISYLSGMNFQTVGFGLFDMKWFIKASSHDIGSGGYQTSLTIRGTLEGY